MPDRQSRIPLTAPGGDPATPRALLEKGSPDWCHRTLARLRYAFEQKKVDEDEFNSVLMELERYQAWDKVPEGRPYGSPDAMLKAEIGLTRQEAAARVKALADEANPQMTGDDLRRARAEGGKKGGRGKKSEKPSLFNKEGFYGTSSSYLTDRIATQAPHVLEGMKAGEYRSVRAAAIAAGIIKVPVPLEKIKKGWAKLSAEDRAAFLEWVQQQEEPS